MAKKLIKFMSDDGITLFDTLEECEQFDNSCKIAEVLDKTNRKNPSNWIIGCDYTELREVAQLLLVPGVVDDIQKILKKI